MWSIVFFQFQDHVKKMLERAEQLQRGRISTHVVRSIFSANTDDQYAQAMKQLEGKWKKVIKRRKGGKKEINQLFCIERRNTFFYILHGS